MFKTGTGTVAASLFVICLVFMALLPSHVAGKRTVREACSFPQTFCRVACDFRFQRDMCCRCYGVCCQDEDKEQQAHDDADPPEDMASDRNPQQPTAQEAQEEEGSESSPERLVLAPKSAGLLPHGFQPISALPTAAPPAAPTSCFEPGFPDVVRKEGPVWFSLVRPCRVLKCTAGVIEVVMDNCEPSSEVTVAPKPSAQPTAAAATSAQSSGRYRSCTHSGRTYRHGATWPTVTVPCGMYRCTDGEVHLAGFSCPSSAPEPDPAVSDPAVPDPAASDPAVPDPTFPDPATPETHSQEPGVTGATGTAPALAPRPSFPDSDSGEAEASCVDDYGQLQTSGNVWTVPSSPCVRYRCQDGTVVTSAISCTPTPPGCTPLPQPQGQCCPSYSCPQRSLDCSYDGRTYMSGAVFADDRRHPCQQKTCDDGLVVALGPATVCPAVYCTEPDWPEGACCKTCPAEELPEGLEELKQLVLKMGQRLNLPAELMTRLEDSVGRMVAQLAALMLDPDSNVTLETLVRNLIEMVDILNALDTSVVDSSITDTEVLLSQLRVGLLSLVDRLKSTLSDDQILNVNIDIGEFISWLQASQKADKARVASILMNDLTRLLSGLLLEPGCTDAVGTVHPVDTLFVDDPGSPQRCYVCANLTAGVAPLAVMNISDCGGPPPPGCTAHLAPNSCCPRVQCAPGEAACRDDRGQLHPHGSIYVDDPKRPCTTYNCSNGAASIIDRISCMAIPPGCTPWQMDGFCCPKSDCPEPDCLYEGRTRDHGTTWPQDPLRPCVTLTCLRGRVTSEDRSPHCPPPPEDHCVPRQVNYQCCPEYDCVTVNCTYKGRVYREGQTWPDDERYPCKRYSCTRHGTEKVQDLTELCRDRPYAACSGHRAEGQCCKQWICPQCLYGGRNHSEGSVFWDDPERRCAQLICQAGRPRRLTPLTTCPPVPEGCTPNYVGTSCCHAKYTCPSCMFDPQGNFLKLVDRVISGPFGGASDGPGGSG